MKTKDVYQLKKGDKVNHKHLGLCTVSGFVPDFGPTLIPDTIEGKNKLTTLSGMPPGTPLLETSFRLFQSA